LDNNSAVISISGGTLELRNGTITGNNGGSGVSVSNNSSSSFIMSGGTISGNTAPKGGGVYLTGGSFTMSGGNISGNTAIDDSKTGYGGGVYLTGGSFTMSGGNISGNTCGSVPLDTSGSIGLGGGVCVYSAGNFTMTGGTISNNSASGGQNYSGDPYEVVLGSIITGWNDQYFVGGGGVYILRAGSSFTKSGGGIISGNNVTSGRVFVGDGNNWTFNSTLNGKEVFWDNPPARYRNTPLGTADNISTNTMSGWGQ